MNAMEMIQAERERQIRDEHWTPVHDDATHQGNELAKAALCYWDCQGPEEEMPQTWPWDVEAWKPKDRVKNLVRAGALALAAASQAERRSVTKKSGRAAFCRYIAYEIAKDLEEELKGNQQYLDRLAEVTKADPFSKIHGPFERGLETLLKKLGL